MTALIKSVYFLEARAISRRKVSLSWTTPLLSVYCTINYFILTLTFLKEDAVVFNDAVALVMYYMKRASSLTKEEATKIKGFLTHTLSEFCYYPRYW